MLKIIKTEPSERRLSSIADMICDELRKLEQQNNRLTMRDIELCIYRVASELSHRERYVVHDLVTIKHEAKRKPR